MRSIKLQSLLTKKFTRKEFLIAVGLAILTLTGISTLISRASNPTLLTGKAPKASSGFGQSVYGGVRRGNS